MSLTPEGHQDGPQPACWSPVWKPVPGAPQRGTPTEPPAAQAEGVAPASCLQRPHPTRAAHLAATSSGTPWRPPGGDSAPTDHEAPE